MKYSHNRPFDVRMQLLWPTYIQTFQEPSLEASSRTLYWDVEHSRVRDAPGKLGGNRKWLAPQGVGGGVIRFVLASKYICEHRPPAENLNKSKFYFQYSTQWHEATSIRKGL